MRNKIVTEAQICSYTILKSLKNAQAMKCVYNIKLLFQMPEILALTIYFENIFL